MALRPLLLPLLRRRTALLLPPLASCAAVQCKTPALASSAKLGAELGVSSSCASIAGEDSAVISSANSLGAVDALAATSSGNIEGEDSASIEGSVSVGGDRSVDDLCLRLVKRLPEKIYVQLAKRTMRYSAMTRPTSSKAAAQAQRVFVRDIKSLLKAFRSEFDASVDAMGAQLTLDTLEAARAAFEQHEIYKAAVRLPSAAASAKRFAVCQEPRRAADLLLQCHAHQCAKVFFENLPVDITTDQLMRSIAHFGEVVAVELFKERAPKRALDLRAPTEPSSSSEASSSEASSSEASPSDASPSVLQQVSTAELQRRIRRGGGGGSSDENGDGDVRENEADEDEVVEVCTGDADGDVLLPTPAKPPRHRNSVQRQHVPSSNIYAAVYFQQRAAADAALSDAVQIFGVAMQDSKTSGIDSRPIYRLCRSSPPPAALFIGNLPFNIHGYAIEDELYELIVSKAFDFAGIRSCMQTDQFNLGRGSIIVQFESHEIAQQAFTLLCNERLRGRPLRIGWVTNIYLHKIDASKRRKRRMKEFVPWH